MLGRSLPRSAVRRRGAVLAEVIMAGMIGSLILSVLPGFYFGYIKLWQRETGKLGSVREADFTVRRMKREIRNARSAVVSADGTAVTVVLPKLAYDAQLGMMGASLDGNGQLVDGDQVRYYFVLDPDNTGDTGGAIYRRVTHANGAAGSPQMVASHIYPQLNPLSASTGAATPLFAYDESARVVAVSLTAGEPKPSSSTFGPSTRSPRCERDGADLVRVATPGHPEGVIQCSHCGSRARPSVQIVTYETLFKLRNR